MKSVFPLTRTLRLGAVAFFVAGLALWIFSGARIGWTQTSTVRTERDEITGIEYPVRSSGFVAGIEVPLAGTAGALALGGLSLLTQRRTARGSV